MPEPRRVPERDVFNRLIGAQFDDVWRFLRRRVATAADADDLTAEVFTTAWRRISTLPEPPEDRLWLFGVARHVLSNHRRSATRRERLHLRVMTQSDPVARVEHPDRDSGVWQALADLDPDDREIIMLRAWDGLAISEIATLMGTTPNAMTQRYAKAKQRLAGRLALDEKDFDATHTHPGRPGHVVIDPTDEPAPDTTTDTES